MTLTERSKDNRDLLNLFIVIVTSHFLFAGFVALRPKSTAMVMGGPQFT